MKVLFAVSNENISNSIVKKYQQMYKEIISYYYNNQIISVIYMEPIPLCERMRYAELL